MIILLRLGIALRETKGFTETWATRISRAELETIPSMADLETIPLMAYVETISSMADLETISSTGLMLMATKGI